MKCYTRKIWTKTITAHGIQMEMQFHKHLLFDVCSKSQLSLKKHHTYSREHQHISMKITQGDLLPCRTASCSSYKIQCDSVQRVFRVLNCAVMPPAGVREGASKPPRQQMRSADCDTKRSLHPSCSVNCLPAEGCQR